MLQRTVDHPAGGCMAACSHFMWAWRCCKHTQHRHRQRDRMCMQSLASPAAEAAANMRTGKSNPWSAAAHQQDQSVSCQEMPAKQVQHHTPTNARPAGQPKHACTREATHAATAPHASIHLPPPPIRLLLLLLQAQYRARLCWLCSASELLRTRCPCC